MLALLGGVVGCSLFEKDDEGDNVTVVSSADGSATLSLPEGALPEGVSASDITITTSSLTETDTGEVVPVWTFEPDGLVFIVPVELRLRVDVPPGEFFVVRHTSQSGALVEDLLPSPEGMVVAGDGTLEEVVVSLGHFSDVSTFNFSGFFGGGTRVNAATAEWAPEPGDAAVGGQVSAAFRIEVPDSFTNAFRTGAGGIEVVWAFSSTTPPWGAFVTWTEPSGTLDPNNVTDPVTGTEGIMAVPRSFTCTKVATYGLKALAVVSLHGTEQWTDRDVTEPTQDATATAVVDLSSTGECIAADTRSTKPEFSAEETDLGTDRIESLSVPGNGEVTLADHAGKYGYYIQLEPGQSITVSVIGGGVGINYYPEFSPGYNFTDTVPGTTVLKNLDTAKTNGVLVVLDGSGTATISVVAGG